MLHCASDASLFLCACFNAVCFFQCSVLLSRLCACLDALCLSQCSVLVSMLCASFNALCLFQCSVLVSMLCACFNALCYPHPPRPNYPLLLLSSFATLVSLCYSCLPLLLLSPFATLVSLRYSVACPQGFFRTLKIAFLSSAMPAWFFSDLKNNISEQ